MISGAKGQDASYLAELLLSKGYFVVALERPSNKTDYENIIHLLDDERYDLEQCDITDLERLSFLVSKYKPIEFYNLAAQSFVGVSWESPVETCESNFLGVLNCLEAIRKGSPSTKFLQASTSESYGDVKTSPQNEETEALPRNPYGVSKYAAEHLVNIYRDHHSIFACFARSFNHESPRRGKNFVTRKITSSIAEMWEQVVDDECLFEDYLSSYPDANELFKKAMDSGIITQIPLGNIEAERDWSHAEDVVRGFYLMLQQDSPDDFVFASGISNSIEKLLSAAFDCINISDWKDLIVIDPRFYRPTEVNMLVGDSSKAKKELGWNPEISFRTLVEDMVRNDIEIVIENRRNM